MRNVSFKSNSSAHLRCRELSDVILVNAARVKAAIKLTQEDAQTINVLRKVGFLYFNVNSLILRKSIELGS